MSKRIIISQVLEDIANKLDDQGLHDVADQVTEDLMRVASGGNIRTAFLKKLFRGVGKALRNPAFQGLAAGYLAKQLGGKPKPQPQPNENDPWGWMRNLGQQPKPEDFATPEDYQNYLNTMSGQPSVSPPPPSPTPPQPGQGQQGYLFGLTPQVIQMQKYYQFQLQKAKDPKTNIPVLIQQVSKSNLKPAQKQEIINAAKKTFESSALANK